MAQAAAKHAGTTAQAFKNLKEKDEPIDSTAKKLNIDGKNPKRASCSSDAPKGPIQSGPVGKKLGDNEPDKLQLGKKGKKGGKKGG